MKLHGRNISTAFSLDRSVGKIAYHVSLKSVCLSSEPMNQCCGLDLNQKPVEI